jgi:small subunit ribosomal protein S2
MSRVNVQQLVMAGAHFGHLTSRWNPKMRPYIFMEKNGIYIIDLNKTLKMIENALAAIGKITAAGEQVLYVGTKKQARDLMRDEATRAGMPYVNERWLGGMLTNFTTIRKSIKKLETLEKKAVDGTYENITKKERLMLEKQKEKLERNLSGMRSMKRLPGAVFVVDTLQEEIAVREAVKLGIPIFAIVDTNADPDQINFPIPANDDAYKSIGLITKTFTDAVIEGSAHVQAKKQAEAEETGGRGGEGGGAEKKRPSGPRRRRSAAPKAKA